MKARLIACALLGAGLTLTVSQARAQGTVPPTAPPTETSTPAAPEGAAPAPEAAALPAVVEPPPDPAAEGAPAEEAELTAAELSAMGLTAEGAGTSASAVDTSLKLSGFADVGMITPVFPKSSPWNGSPQLNRHTSFYVGNINLYLSKNLTESVRMFGEVRFLLLPNGSPDSSSPTGQLINATAGDYTDFNRQIQWGGINLQRLYIEWTAYRALVFRAGQYLTPYGIWNVDHGSPTIVSVQRPFIIGQQLFPERQTGLEILGQFDASAHHSFGYDLALSNGTGPASSYRDFDGNKAVTGRAWWRFDGFGELRVGTTGYYGRYTAATESAGPASDGKHAKFTQTIQSSYDTLSLAADLKWTYGGLLVQSELITQQRKYLEAHRTGAVNPLLGRYLASNDKLSLGVYGLIGYRFDWYGIMPYFLVQNMNTNDPSNASVLRVAAYYFGLNVRPVDSLVFKLEFTEAHFPRDSLVGSSPVRFIQAQIAWAF